MRTDLLDPSAAGQSEAELARRTPGLVRGFIAGLGLPTRLSEVGVGESDYDLIADDEMQDFVVAFAPVEVSKDEVRSLLVEAG